MSLLDIMRKFDAWGLAMLLHHLDHSVEVIKPMASNPDMRDEKLESDSVKMWIEPIIVHANITAKAIALESTFDRVCDNGPFAMAAKLGLTWQQAENQLRVLRECIEADLEKRTFVFVPPAKAEILAPRSIADEWGEVVTAIQPCEEDVKEALYCYALERNTAAVFHLMRVAEWGMRAFARHLKLLHTKVVRKSGTVKLTPIGYSTWEDILRELRSAVNTKLSQIKRGNKRQQLQEFYNPVLADIESFKDAWRNHVMHTRREYNAKDVASIMSHVQTFMSLLVGNGVTRA